MENLLLFFSQYLSTSLCSLKKKDLLFSLCLNPYLRICSLILEREEGRERQGEREKHRCTKKTSICCSPFMPTMRLPGWNLQPFGVWGWCSNQLSHPARAILETFKHICALKASSCIFILLKILHYIYWNIYIYHDFFN